MQKNKILRVFTMTKKVETSFNNIFMLMFNCAILFMSMWIDKSMLNTNSFKISVQFFIITTLIHLYRFNFSKKISFNLSLKLLKNNKNIIFDNQRKEPNIFSISIHKNNKITKTIRKEHKERSLNINKYQFKRRRSFVTCKF
jgi:hypothetical protein